MEERLSKWFEYARAEGKSVSEIYSKFFTESSDKIMKMPEFFTSRKNGLNIIESQLAALISQELKRTGPEVFLLRLESKKESSPLPMQKKRIKKSKAEPNLKKKRKTEAFNSVLNL